VPLLPLVTLASIILLPVIPAFFLFKVLPSTADVSGPLQGLTIKLSGAFAGYFAVVVMVFATHSVWNPAATYQAWEVYGQLKDAQDGSPISQLGAGDVISVPPTYEASDGGSFKLTIVTMPSPGGGIEYPDLVIGHQDYAPTRISLDPSSLKSAEDKLQVAINVNGRQIRLNNIALQKLAPQVRSIPAAYTGTGTPPVPVPVSEESHQ